MPAPTLPPLDHRFVETGEVTLHVVSAGPTHGPPVVLLHGFPEFWYGWRHQLGALVDAGYHVVVPDQRGYNLSEKPSGVDMYAIDAVVSDAEALLDALGYDEATFVGHDWGAAVVWQLLLRAPRRVDRAVAMNAPHPTVFGRFFPWKPRQLRMAWHMLFFQLPWVSEAFLRTANWRGMAWFVDTSTRPETFSGPTLDRYREAWARPGALTAMLNWYRAMVRVRVPPPPTTRVTTPTMLLWGTRDAYLHTGMARPSIELCDDGRLELLDDASHWLHHEVPDRVTRLVLDFLE